MATPPSSQSIITTARDADLRDRLVAVAAEKRIPNAELWVQARLYELATTAGQETGETLAYIYDYAQNVYRDAVAALPPKPGINPGAVTDANLRYAIDALRSAELGEVADAAPAVGEGGA